MVFRACFHRSQRLVGPAAAVLVFLHCAVRGAAPDHDVQLQQIISLFHAIDSDADGQLNVTELRTQLNKSTRIERLRKRKRAHGASHKQFAEALARCGAACPDGKLALDHVRDVHHVRQHAKAHAHTHHYARVAGARKVGTEIGTEHGANSDSASVARAATARTGHRARQDAHDAAVRDRFRFADTDGDGGIDKEEFFVLTRPHEAAHERHTAHQVEHHMRLHDIDGDGKMSFEEHFAPHQSHAHSRSGAGGEQHRQLLPDLQRRESVHFKQFDLNKDGMLDKAELTRFLFPVHFQDEIVRKKLNHVLRVADSNGDNTVALGEAMPMAQVLLSLLQPRDIAPAVRHKDEL